MNGFSIAKYRNANKVTLYICEKASPGKPIFSAYYTGGIDYQFQLNTGNFDNIILGVTNRVLTNPLVRSTMRSFGATGALSAMDTPLKPYIEGVNPMTHTLECYLPLITETTAEGSDPYYENIVNPIQNLLNYVMPGRMEIVEVANKVLEKFGVERGVAPLNEIVDGIINKLVPPNEKAQFGTNIQESIQALWNIANKMGKQWWDDFANDAYFLTEPVQFLSDYKIRIQLGEKNPIQDDPVYVTSVNVGLGPNIYSDGNRSYPAFAKVVLNLTRRTKPTRSYNFDLNYDPQALRMKVVVAPPTPPVWEE